MTATWGVAKQVGIGVVEFLTLGRSYKQTVLGGVADRDSLSGPLLGCPPLTISLKRGQFAQEELFSEKPDGEGHAGFFILSADLEQHPLSQAFPAMSEPDLESLAEDIAKFGQQEPGVLLEGMVLDGWHRYRACVSIGVEFKATEFSGLDPRAYVISKNLHRRHLSASQRAQAIVDASNWRPVGRLKPSPSSETTMNSAPGAELPSGRFSSVAQMAKEADVGTRTIEQAKEVSKAGLSEPVRKGEISVKKAAEIAKLPQAKRDAAIMAASEKYPKEPKAPKEDPRDAEIAFLKNRVEELTQEKADVADTAQELKDKLDMLTATEPDEQQQLIAQLQKENRALEAEVSRLRIDRQGLFNKVNQLIRQVKIVEKANGRAAA